MRMYIYVYIRICANITRITISVHHARSVICGISIWWIIAYGTKWWNTIGIASEIVNPRPDKRAKITVSRHATRNSWANIRARWIEIPDVLCRVNQHREWNSADKLSFVEILFSALCSPKLAFSSRMRDAFELFALKINRIWKKKNSQLKR